MGLKKGGGREGKRREERGVTQEKGGEEGKEEGGEEKKREGGGKGRGQEQGGEGREGKGEGGRRRKKEQKEEEEERGGGYGCGCYYPAVVVATAFIAHFLTSGMAFSVGVYYVTFLEVFGGGSGLTAWIGSLNFGSLCAAGE